MEFFLNHYSYIAAPLKSGQTNINLNMSIVLKLMLVFEVNCIPHCVLCFLSGFLQLTQQPLLLTYYYYYIRYDVMGQDRTSIIHKDGLKAGLENRIHFYSFQLKWLNQKTTTTNKQKLNHLDIWFKKKQQQLSFVYRNGSIVTEGKYNLKRGYQHCCPPTSYMKTSVFSKFLVESSDVWSSITGFDNWEKQIKKVALSTVGHNSAVKTKSMTKYEQMLNGWFVWSGEEMLLYYEHMWPKKMKA